MTALIGKVVHVDGREFLIIGIEPHLEMFIAREVGRNFKMWIGYEELFRF